MKKIFSIILCIGLILFLTGCGETKSQIGELSTRESNIVSFYLEEGTLSNIAGTFIINHYMNRDIYYKNAWYMEKLVNNQWYQMKEINEVTGTDGWLLMEHGKMTVRYDWERRYGKLDKGTYRIVKRVCLDTNDVQEYYISAVFNI